jgi:hypothetical protein
MELDSATVFAAMVSGSMDRFKIKYIILVVMQYLQTLVEWKF